MIDDHTIVSARTEKSQMVPAKRLVRRILTAITAGILLLPSPAAWGMDPIPGKSVSADAFKKRIALPPIPHLEATLWMQWNEGVNALKIDMLMPTQAQSDWLALAPRQHLAAPSIGS